MKPVGDEMMTLIARLYPICRSITGAGVRETLEIIREQIPIDLHEVPSGTKVLDWTVPKEWNIRDAWIKNSAGKRLVDFRKLNLHVVSYSVPIRRTMRLAELREHLFTLPAQPDQVPYRTSYYKEDWGFCLSESQLAQFRDDEEYDVWIDSSLENGRLTFGELLIKGEEPGEVLISCHVCHPSLADDNLSGLAVATELARGLSGSSHRYSYRFLFVPGTIGAITWLGLNEAATRNVRHGFVLTCVGDSAHLTYKRSRQGTAEIDRAFAHVLSHSGKPSEVIDFSPYGYDERQYCSPGFDLPVGCLMRSRHGEFPEYHTSADNLQFVRAEALADSLATCRSVIDLLESNRTFLSKNPKGEPQLGRRGVYPSASGDGSNPHRSMALLWILNLSDGRHSLLDIAERAKLPFSAIKEAVDVLAATDLLEPC
ncbi:MAG: DUF4910 domain-containing protein [Spartobacteria bacterium]